MTSVVTYVPLDVVDQRAPVRKSGPRVRGGINSNLPPSIFLTLHTLVCLKYHNNAGGDTRGRGTLCPPTRKHMYLF